MNHAWYAMPSAAAHRREDHFLSRLQVWINPLGDSAERTSVLDLNEADHTQRALARLAAEEFHFLANEQPIVSQQPRKSSLTRGDTESTPIQRAVDRVMNKQRPSHDGHIKDLIHLEHYLEFAHPYLKRICDAFPADWVKVYHNDADVSACLEHLPDTGFNVLNWGKQKDIAEVKERVGDRMCLMGNVNPLEIGVRGTPEEVRDATLEVLEKSGGEGIILSVGGGTSPGMPRANIIAMQAALAEYNQKRSRR